jgi:hypothetical protein
MWKNVVEMDRAQTTIWPCTLHIGYQSLQTHTLRICNTYWFFKVTTFRLTRISVTLYIHYFTERQMTFCLHEELQECEFWWQLLRKPAKLKPIKKEKILWKNLVNLDWETNKQEQKRITLLYCDDNQFSGNNCTGFRKKIPPPLPKPCRPSSSRERGGGGSIFLQKYVNFYQSRCATSQATLNLKVVTVNLKCRNITECLGIRE